MTKATEAKATELKLNLQKLKLNLQKIRYEILVYRLKIQKRSQKMVIIKIHLMVHYQYVVKSLRV